jgi:hypothetical protein
MWSRSSVKSNRKVCLITPSSIGTETRCLRILVFSSYIKQAEPSS